MYKNKPAAPISYTETARFQRAVQVLSDSDRRSLITAVKAHQEHKNILSLQQCGQFLHVNIADEAGETVNVYDFGRAHNVQACLTALNDFLRSERAAVKVLMPGPASVEA